VPRARLDLALGALGAPVTGPAEVVVLVHEPRRIEAVLAEVGVYLHDVTGEKVGAVVLHFDVDELEALVEGERVVLEVRS
jgi:hypothetical protein